MKNKAIYLLALLLILVVSCGEEESGSKGTVKESGVVKTVTKRSASIAKESICVTNENICEPTLCKDRNRDAKLLGGLIECRLSEICRLDQPSSDRSREIIDYVEKKLAKLKSVDTACYESAKMLAQNSFSKGNITPTPEDKKPLTIDKDLLSVYRESITDKTTGNIVQDRLEEYFKTIKNIENSELYKNDDGFILSSDGKKPVVINAVQASFDKLLYDVFYKPEQRKSVELTPYKTFGVLLADYLTLARTAAGFSENTGSSVDQDNDSDLSPAALAIVLGHSFQPVYERVEYFTKIQDVVCKLSDCPKGDGAQSEVHTILKFFASMADEVPFSSIDLDNITADDDKGSNGKLKETLQSLKKNFKSIKYMMSAIKQQYSTNKMASNRSFWFDSKISMPDNFMKLYTIINGSEMYIRNFEKTGYFSGKSINSSTVGFSKENLSKVISFSKNFENKLNSERGEFEKERGLLATQELSDLQSNVTTDNLNYTLKSAMQDYAYTLKDLKGVSEAIQNGDFQYSQYMGNALKAMENSKFKNLYAKQEIMNQIGSMEITARDASKFLMYIPAIKGEIVKFNVSGGWKPTCAIKSSGVFGNVSDPLIGPEGYMLNVSNAVSTDVTFVNSNSGAVFDNNTANIQDCSRKAYSTSVSDSKSSSENRSKQNYSNTSESDIKSATTQHVESHSDTSSSSHSDTFQIAAGIRTTVKSPGGGLSPVSVTAYVDISKTKSWSDTDTETDTTSDSFSESDQHLKNVTTGAQISKTKSEVINHVKSSNSTNSNEHSSCYGGSHGSSKTTTNTNSSSERSEQRTGSSFAQGLRLGNTPFPEAPVGSLVLVKVSQTNGKIYDVSVIGRDSTFIMEEDTWLYVVGNDCLPNQSDSSLDTNKMYVKMGKYVPFDMEAKSATEALLKAVEIIRDRSEKLLKMGSFGSLEYATLEAEVRSNVATNGYDVSKYPVLNDMFTFWIKHELAQLERKVRVIQLERKLDLQSIEINRMINNISDLETSQDNLHKLLVHWSLHNLDQNRLGVALGEYLEFVEGNFLTALKFRYPTILREVNGYDEFQELKGITLNSSLSNISKTFTDLMEKVKTKTGLYDIEETDNFKTVILSVPNPFYKGNLTNGIPTNSYYDRNCMNDSVNDAGDGNFVEKSTECKETSFPVVDQTTATDIWSRLNDKNGEHFTVEIKPEDIYGKAKIAMKGSLGCEFLSPVIMHSALYFIDPHGQESQGLNATVKKIEDLNFPNADVNEPYILNNKLYDHYEIPVYFGLKDGPDGADVIYNDVFKRGMYAMQTDTGQGRALFSTFTISTQEGAIQSDSGIIGTTRTPINDIPEMLLMFTVWTQKDKNGKTIKWLKNCPNEGSDPCDSGATKKEVCGFGGTQTLTCLNGYWVDGNCKMPAPTASRHIVTTTASDGTTNSCMCSTSDSTIINEQFRNLMISDDTPIEWMFDHRKFVSYNSIEIERDSNIFIDDFADIEFKAGKEIILRPDFIAPFGSEVKLNIGYEYYD